ncbi:MAG: hypothetical protein FWE37_06505 [Spirochaetaceae bacterium]|nr:hypothetical protein [Spirochaetaceae bacterium]
MRRKEVDFWLFIALILIYLALAGRIFMAVISINHNMHQFTRGLQEGGLYIGNWPGFSLYFFTILPISLLAIMYIKQAVYPNKRFKIMILSFSLITTTAYLIISLGLAIFSIFPINLINFLLCLIAVVLQFVALKLFYKRKHLSFKFTFLLVTLFIVMVLAVYGLTMLPIYFYFTGLITAFDDLIGSAHYLLSFSYLVSLMGLLMLLTALAFYLLLKKNKIGLLLAYTSFIAFIAVANYLWQNLRLLLTHTVVPLLTFLGDVWLPATLLPLISRLNRSIFTLFVIYGLMLIILCAINFKTIMAAHAKKRDNL